ncbi:hypothetical protein HPB50_004045 [Hyalomma asiaticum]|uniref:Uncharacterized protein n=1 Tax=Hyalomma asiaticum TaxID=266040 RepID=A0ACB7SBY8_HYAAI|nr:hypothetical protein HPB50_004045 [Hyalomma asiaticum]
MAAVLPSAEGGGAIPESAKRVLGLVDKTELLGLVRSTASRAALSDRIVLEWVEALPSKLSGIKRPPLASVVQCLREGNLKLLQSDKEGGFVVLASDVYREKAYQALQDNFREANDFHRAKAKKMALEKCGEAGLSKLTAALADTVHEGIEVYGATRFQNAVGTSVSRFMDLLQLYISSTVIKRDDVLYVQCDGVCIGSCPE